MQSWGSGGRGGQAQLPEWGGALLEHCCMSGILPVLLGALAFSFPGQPTAFCLLGAPTWTPLPGSPPGLTPPGCQHIPCLSQAFPWYSVRQVMGITSKRMLCPFIVIESSFIANFLPIVMSFSKFYFSLPVILCLSRTLVLISKLLDYKFKKVSRSACVC